MYIYILFMYIKHLIYVYIYMYYLCIYHLGSMEIFELFYYAGITIE